MLRLEIVGLTLHPLLRNRSDVELNFGRLSCHSSWSMACVREKSCKIFWLESRLPHQTKLRLQAQGVHYQYRPCLLWKRVIGLIGR